MASTAQIAANLVLHELLPRLKKRDIEIANSPIPPEQIGEWTIAKHRGEVSTHEIRKRMDAWLSSFS